MLALLRVAPLLPSPTLRAVPAVMPGRDGKAGSLIELESRVWVPLTEEVSPPPQPMMYFYSAPPMQFLSGVDMLKLTKRDRIVL